MAASANRTMKHVVTLEDESNFEQWKLQITLILKSAKCWSVIGGAATETRRPTAAGNEQTAWDDKDILAQSLIVPTLSKRQTAHIYTCTTARAIFNRLKDINADSSTLNKQHTMASFLTYRISPSQSVIAAYQDIEHLANSLREMGSPQDDGIVITKIVSALPDSKYAAFKRAWDSVSPHEQSMSSLLARLKKEEMDQKSSMCQTSDDEESTSATAFAAKYRRPDSRKNQRPQSEEHEKQMQDLKKKSTCYKCGEKGHWQNDEICTMYRKKSTSQFSYPTVFLAASVNKPSRFPGAVSFMAAATPGEEDIWYADSGATAHISGRRGWFIKYTAFPEPREIMVTDGRRVYAPGFGNVLIEALIGDVWIRKIIDNVLYVPGAVNLFSEITMTRRGYVIRRNEEEAVFYQKGKKGPSATVQDDLYVMKFRPCPSENFPALMAMSAVLKPKNLLHQRLAHTHVQAIRDTVKKNAAYGLEMDDLDPPVTWGSCKQPTVALSSTEAEYVALATGAKEAKWTRTFLDEIQMPTESIPIMVDNQSAIKLAHTPDLHKRTKHIDIKWHFTRNMVAANEIKVVYAPTTEQPADLLTKPLLKTKFNELRDRLGLSLPLPSPRALFNNWFFKMFTLLAVFFMCAAVPLPLSQPVLWRRAKNPIINGYRKYSLHAELISPCTLITPEVVGIDHYSSTRSLCEKTYKSMYLDELTSLCTPKSRVRVKRIFDPVTWSIIGVGALVSVAIGGMSISNTVFSSKQGSTLAAIQTDVSRLQDHLRTIDARQIVLQIMEKRLNADINEIQGNLTDLSNRIEEVHAYAIRSANVLSYINARLLLAKDALRESKRVWSHGTVSGRLLESIPVELPCEEDQCPLKFSIARECELLHDGRDLYVEFLLPEVNSTIYALRADPFKLQIDQDNQTCVGAYNGPSTVLFAATSFASCILTENVQIPSDGSPIGTPSNFCKPTDNNVTDRSRYRVGECVPKQQSHPDNFLQIKYFHLENHIYCPGSVIEINSKTQPCPNDTFVLPAVTRYRLNGQDHHNAPVTVFAKGMEADPLFNALTNWHVYPKKSAYQPKEDILPPVWEPLPKLEPTEPQPGGFLVLLGFALVTGIILTLILGLFLFTRRMYHRVPFIPIPRRPRTRSSKHRKPNSADEEEFRSMVSCVKPPISIQLNDMSSYTMPEDDAEYNKTCPLGHHKRIMSSVLTKASQTSHPDVDPVFDEDD